MNGKFWKGSVISEIYNRSLVGVMQADIFRYCILYEMGGFYVDIARHLPLPLKSYINKSSNYALFFNANADSSHIQAAKRQTLNNMPFYRSIKNTFLAFAPRHEILKKTIDNICENYILYTGHAIKNPRMAIINLTGPGALMRSVLDYCNSEKIDSKCVYFINDDESTLKGSNLRYIDVPFYGFLANRPLLKPDSKNRESKIMFSDVYEQI